MLNPLLSPTPEANYRSLKGKILQLISSDLSSDEYKALVHKLTVNQLRVQLQGEQSVLWWVVYAAFCGKPALFIDIWNRHRGSLTHHDFSDLQGSKGSPFWHLAAIAKSQPKFIMVYFRRFRSDIKAECISEARKVNNQNHVSILGLLADAATSQPTLFEEIWPVLKQHLNSSLLNTKWLIGGIYQTPIHSLLQATFVGAPTERKQETLNPEIIHFCFEQFGDLRPGFPNDFTFPDNITIKNEGYTPKVVDLKRLQQHKNAFFDELNRVHSEPTHSYEHAKRLALAAMQAGFLNPCYYMAKHFSDLQQFDLVYESLELLPNGSIFQQDGLSKCADWYLVEAFNQKENTKQLNYLEKAISCCLKIPSTDLRVNLLHKITYFYIHGKLLDENTTIQYKFLNRIKQNTPAKAFLLLLSKHKIAIKGIGSQQTEPFYTTSLTPYFEASTDKSAFKKPCKPEAWKSDEWLPLFSEEVSQQFPVLQCITNLSYKDEKPVTETESPTEGITETITQADYALPLAPELADIDPLIKIQLR